LRRFVIPKTALARFVIPRKSLARFVIPRTSLYRPRNLLFVDQKQIPRLCLGMTSPGVTMMKRLIALVACVLLPLTAAAQGQLYPWARRISDISKNRVSGVYGGIIALGYNSEVMAKRKLPIPKCWKDLAKPVYKGEIMLGNPNSSGTAYLMLATVVQVFGEDDAFTYLAEVHKNVNQYARSGIGPMAAVTRGKTAIGSTVLHGVINEIVRGFPV